MKVNKKPTKLCDELTFADYLEHPIWGFWDDDGDEVTFADTYDSFDAVGGEALWVRSEFLLNDGTRLPGVVGFRITNWSVYLLEFIEPDGSIFQFPVNSMLEGTVSSQKIAELLGKSEDKIFPVRYETICELKEGKRIAGIYQWTGKNK